MIYEELRERVGVRAEFVGGEATPLAFRRKGRVHVIREVCARWEDRRGGSRVLYFSCLDDAGDLYQLHLEGADLVWHLDAVQLAPAGGRRERRRPPAGGAGARRAGHAGP